MAERRARAATMPTGELDFSSSVATATTQPSEPASQPSVAEVDPDAIAKVPATQPVSGTESVSIDDEMGGGVLPTTNPSDDDFNITADPEATERKFAPASQPASQPATAPSSSAAGQSSVTELPSEPVNVNSGGSWSGGGDNK
jgi:hypothetical protein